MANVRPFRSALSREGGQRSHLGATEVRRKGVSKGLTFAIYIYIYIIHMDSYIELDSKSDSWHPDGITGTLA